MSIHRQQLANRFACTLNHALIKRFGKSPSAATVAMHFNSKANTTERISQETARRWMRGLSLPELHRFQILSLWLGINKEDFLHKNSKGQFTHLDKPAQTINTKLQSRVIENIKFSTSDELEDAMLNIMRALNPQDQQAILLTALALTAKQRVAH